eukprot:913637_1
MNLSQSILFLHLLSICNGYMIKTDFEYEYYNKSIVCIDGEHCEIDCRHNYGCKYSQITCPEGFDCNMYFSATESGYGTFIFAQNSNNIVISATASSSARGTDVYAPKQEMNMSCTNSYSCFSAIIYGNSNDSDIIANCDGYYSCAQMQLFTDHVPSMAVSCTGSYSCQYMKLYQQSALSPSQLGMECAGPNSCEYATIKSSSQTLQIECGACSHANIWYSPMHSDANGSIVCATGACSATDIWAIEGVFDISVMSDVAQSNLNLHCGINYYHACELQPSMDSNTMLCDDNDFCMNYQRDPLTDYDIIIQRSYAKYNDTVECDSDLNHCSVYCIGKYSCAYADIICPQNNDDATCTIWCQSYACSHATVIAHNISSLVLITKSDYGLQYVTTEVSYLKNVIFHCDNGYGCEYMTVTAVNTMAIDIQCRGSYSCQSANVLYVSDGDYISGYTVPAIVNLDCYGYYSCRSGSVNSNAGHLSVQCNRDSPSTDGCYALSVYCPQSSLLLSANDATTYCEVLCGKTDSCISLNVYSINGWNNAHVSSINGQSINGPTMHCNPAFSQSCTMQRHVNSGDWYCDDSEICSDYRWDVHATLFIPTHSYQYYNKTIECVLDADCYIFCGESYSCKYSTIQCANANCSIYCYGTDSCKYAVIEASNTKTLNIYATASSALSYSTIHSSRNYLQMECSSSYSCQYQTIYASYTSEITMDCSSSHSCGYQLLYAENSNNIYQRCGGSWSCTNSALYQYLSPLSSSDIADLDCRGTYSCYQSSITTSLSLNLLCESDHSCDSLDVFVPPHQPSHILCVADDACRNIDVMSLNGFINSNVNITSFDDSYANSGKFYCGYGFTNFCALSGLINSHQWICTDTNNYCYDYQLEEENTDYIVLNYDYEYDYIKCDQTKTNCDIKCKATYGCWNSKVICPMNDDARCSIYCAGVYSCTDLHIYSLHGHPQLSFDCNGNSAFCAGITISNYSVTSIDYSLNKSYIIATYQYQYYNDSVSCTGNAYNECTIKCINIYSCAHSSISFVGDDLDCHLECGALYACKYATIHTEHCRSMNISAGSASSVLQYAIIYLSPNQALSLSCLSSYSCSYATLYGDNNILSLSCHGSYSCAYQYWSIHSAQSVTVECAATHSCRYSQYYVYSVLSSSWNCKGSDSCYGATIKTDAGHTSIYCDADDACYASKLFVPEYSIVNCSHPGACENTAIFSVSGSASLNIVSTPDNALAISNTLYCTESYIESCVLQNDDATHWDCDPSEFCYEYESSNHEHIKTNYKYQFYNSDIVCNHGQNCIITCMHQYGCQYSTIQCPNNYECRIYCGSYGCSHSTINIGNNGHLNLVCYDDYSCSNSIIYGSNTSQSISVQCLDLYSCQYMQVFGQYVPEINVHCLTTYSCRYGQIYQHATDSVASTIDVNCQGRSSCSSMVLKTNAVHAQLMCNQHTQSDYGCNSANIYYNGQTEKGLKILCGSRNACLNNNYYVLIGENGANITAYANAESITLYCCESWIGSCILKYAQQLSDELTCSDGSICAPNGCSFMDSSHVIAPSQTYEYYNQTIVCDNDMDCNIICKAKSACGSATIYCPSDYNCKVYCIDQYSCALAVIQATDSNSLFIRASGSRSLQLATVFAPNNQNQLDIVCSGSYSCAGVKLNAPYSYINTLQCSASFSCSNMHISADYASYVDWICTASYSCSDGMIWHHSTSATYFGLNCKGNYACDDVYSIVSAQNVTINCESGTRTCVYMFIFCKSNTNCTVSCQSQSACYSMDIYAVEPDKTLHVSRGATEFIPEIKLHCGLVYENECNLQATNVSDDLLCVDPICDRHLNYTTTEYIVFQWDYENYKQNITCSTGKTNCEIYCSGSYSCKYNGIQCPSHPNAFCKIYARAYASQSSKIYAESIESIDIIAGGTYAFASSQFYISSDAIDMDCSYSYGCYSMDLILNGNNTRMLTLDCASSYSCRFATIMAPKTNISASLICSGYYSCRQMDMHLQNTDKIYINCGGSRACQSANIYAPNAITYDTLYCGASTTCAGLKTYCAYPSMDKVCTLRYESVPDVWLCEGDICIYDEDCQHYDGLELRPNSGSVLGGDTVLITGPCYNPNINYTCKFGTKQSQLHVINSTHGYCILPSSLESGSVLFAVHEDNEWYGMIAAFFYNDLYMNYSVNISPPPNVLYNDTYMNNATNISMPTNVLFDDMEINVTWNPSDSKFVDINLYQVIPHMDDDGDIVATAHFLLNLKSHVLNNGSNNIPLNNTQTSSGNISFDWDIFDSNWSYSSNILVLTVESLTVVDQIPMRRRQVSNFIIQLYDVYNITNTTVDRRRMLFPIVLPILGWIIRGYAAYKAIDKVYGKIEKQAKKLCDVWRFGDWLMEKERPFDDLPRCPDEYDPDVGTPGCVGPWEPDPRCQDGGIWCWLLHKGAENCIRSAGGQQCCYKKDGDLCREHPCAGRPDLSPLSNGIVKNFIVDVYPYVLCRVGGDLDRYFDRMDRRGGSGGSSGGDQEGGDDGEGGAPEACAPAGGDPHFVTFDLFNYTFNGIGDYYYLYHTDFKILVRMQSFNNGSVITKLGLQIGAASSTFNRSTTATVSTLEVSLHDVDKQLNVYMNGEVMLFTTDMHDISIRIGDISLHYMPSQVIIRTHFGIFIQIWLRAVDVQLQFLDFTVDIESHFKQQVTGLIGNYDDDDSNDLQCRNGTVLLDTSTLEDIHYQFGLSWLLNDEDHNIFHNAFITTIDPINYKPLFGFDDVDDDLLRIAHEACGDVFECIYDVVATEVVQMANTTLEWVAFAEVAAETIKTRYNITERVTPTPTFAGCDVSESMNLYFLVDVNCQITQTQCIEQQRFISTLWEKILSTENGNEQLFGYIEYGNGANELFSLNDYQNANESMVSILKEMGTCNSLEGMVNHPYYALQLAMNGFTRVNNSYNNVILMVSGCAPNLDEAHTCTLKPTFDDGNIGIFVINYRNNDSYSCLVSDMDHHMINMNSYSTDNVDHVLQNICEWIGVSTNEQPPDAEDALTALIQILENNIVWIAIGAIGICLVCLFGCCAWRSRKRRAGKIVYKSVHGRNRSEDVESTIANAEMSEFIPQTIPMKKNRLGVPMNDSIQMR